MLGQEQRLIGTMHFCATVPMANEPSAEQSDNNNGATSTIEFSKILHEQKGNEAMAETREEVKFDNSHLRTGGTTGNGVEMDGTQLEEGVGGIDERSEYEEDEVNDRDTAEESADENEETGDADEDAQDTEAMEVDAGNENQDEDDDEDEDDRKKYSECEENDQSGLIKRESESTTKSVEESRGKIRAAPQRIASVNSEGLNGGSGGSATSSGVPAAAPPPPVLKGTLSYNVDMKRHVIRGMWNYENSNAFPAQRFELVRTLATHEDVKVLPKDGEFHGSFSLAYFHTTSKGKQKERSKVIAESGVKIKFTRVDDEDYDFKVDGQGTNQFGIFNINGTAKKSTDPDDPTYNIELRKRYAPSEVSLSPAVGLVPAVGDTKKNKKNKKRKHSLVGQPNGELDEDDLNEKEVGPMPPPSQTYPSQVVCLRGKLTQDQSDDLGATEVMQRISGMWSSGLDLLLDDPENLRGQCNRFEYEHKSTLPNKQWPVSGRYSGWFDLKNEDGSTTKISERDVVLKFRENNAGYYNVEGRGFNAFGKYNITGTLAADNVLTIFRHFQPQKTKVKERSDKPVTAIPPPLHAPSKVGKTAAAAVPPEPQLRLDQIEITGDEPMKPTEQPEHGTYSAVSRGVLRVNEDGAHTCSGKWGITREQYNNGHTSNFTFRLEPHFAAQSAGDMKKANGETDEVTNEDSADPTSVSLSAAPLGSNTFPVDSAMYKGSFQMKRGATKYTSVIDHQIVLKFRKNTQGAYNVYGKGINSIGIFNLMGTLILSGNGSGHVELYRMYPVVSKPEQVPAQGTQQGNAVGTGGKFSAVNKPKLPTSNHRADNAKVLPGGSSMVGSDPTPVPLAVSRPVSLPGPVPILSGPPMPGGLRRESSRLVKLPSRLEDDDPHAQIGRMMAKCAEIIKFVSEKDNSTGKFFSEPVDPVAHGIPTYYQIINEPMDLGTIQRKMDGNEILTPEEFGRLVRLVFENAMTFNVEPTHVVHQAGRNLLILFNQKFRDVERSIENIRKTHKMSDLEVQRLSTGNSGHPSKEKGDKTAWKKKRSSPKQQLLVDAQAMATANAASLTALLAAAPPDSSPSGHVTRSEFTVMMQMIQRLQEQVLKTLTAVADLSSDQIDETSVAPSIVSTPMHVASHANPIDSFTSPPMTTMLVTEKKKHVSKPKKEECVIEEIPTDEDKPLTLKEQKILTETINALDPSNFPGVIQIIRESADLDDDEEEIDLEIDQLDTVTQRKLQKYVMKVSRIVVSNNFSFLYRLI